MICFFIIHFFFFCGFSFDIVETTIDDIHQAFSSGELNCTTLIRSHIDRIRKYDSSVHSMITINPNAIFTAKQFDESAPFGSLWCIPAIIKDNMDISTMPSSAGSLSLATNFPEEDAPVIKALRNSGVIFLGKANMAEFAMDGLNTNTEIGGQTLNVYAHDRTPYGSSGGVAASITSSFGVIGIGSDTCGSIVNPSSAASLVGLRPNRNKTNDEGIIPLSIVQDVYGPMCRSVKDLAKVWNVLKEISPVYPPFYAPSAPMMSPKKKKNDDDDVVIKVAYMSDFLTPSMGAQQEIMDLVSSYLSDVKSKLPTTVQLFDSPTYFKYAQDLAPYMAQMIQCSIDLEVSYLDDYLRINKTIQNLYSVGELVQSEMLTDLVFESLKASLKVAKDPQTDPACNGLEKLRSLLRMLILQAIQQDEVDILLYPSANQMPPLLKDLESVSSSSLYQNRKNPLSSFGDEGEKKNNGLTGFMTSCVVSAYSGFPSISYPIGYADNHVPFGMIALAKEEDTLIEWANLMEETFSYRKPPSVDSLVQENNN